MENNSSSSHPVPLPTVKGYIVQKKIGSGTYSSVYKAISKNDHNTYAIKCVSRARLTKVSKENLCREIEILKMIKHDHVVRLIDFQWDESSIYLIMEYCDAGDLSKYIRGKARLSEKMAKIFLQQIASALKYLRSVGISHMDLKPQNILLSMATDTPILKIADFGFAQYMKDNNLLTSFRGSPLYMAPEIFITGAYDAKVDLWSVGVILHEVLFGYPPFLSKSYDELKAKIFDEAPVKIDRNTPVSNECRDLLKSLLERNPNKRINFDDFYTHPFVDLERMPSATSITKGRDAIRKAVAFDELQRYGLAYKYYVIGVEYMLAALKYEKDPKSKDEIRRKAKLYMDRIDMLNIFLTKNAKEAKEALSDSDPTTAAAATASTVKTNPQQPQKQPKAKSHDKTIMSPSQTATKSFGDDQQTPMDDSNDEDDFPSLKKWKSYDWALGPASFMQRTEESTNGSRFDDEPSDFVFGDKSSINSSKVYYNNNDKMMNNTAYAYKQHLLNKSFLHSDSENGFDAYSAQMGDMIEKFNRMNQNQNQQQQPQQQQQQRHVKIDTTKNTVQNKQSDAVRKSPSPTSLATSKEATTNADMNLLLKLSSNYDDLNRAILECFKADERLNDKHADSNEFEELLEKYKSSILVILNFLRRLARDSKEARLLKKYTTEWMDKAEFLSDRLTSRAHIERELMARGQPMYAANSGGGGRAGERGGQDSADQSDYFNLNAKTPTKQQQHYNQRAGVEAVAASTNDSAANNDLNKCTIS